MIPLIPISELVVLMRNGTASKQNQEGIGHPVSRIETIAEGTINPRRVRYVNMSDEEVERWRLQPEDILLSHINSIDHIGKCALYTGVPEMLVHGMNLLLLRADTDVVLPRYLFFGLRSNRVRTQIRARCKQAVNQASINQKELGAIELPVPSMEEQLQVVDVLTRAEGIARLHREGLKKSSELMEALLNGAF